MTESSPPDSTNESHATQPPLQPSSQPPATWKQDAANVMRGLLMGGADIVPGVSGGTVALIVGIYQRLINAISSFDRQLLSLLLSRQWKQAAQHIDFRFLLFLGIGILTGIVTLASVVHELLLNYRQPTYAAFGGLIIASGILIARLVGKWNASRIASFAMAFVAAFFIVGLSHLKNPPESHLYTFFCGTIGICAMILPGISGAFLLLVLGRYEEVTSVLKNLKSMNVTMDDLVTILVFVLGCAVGLLVFSKVLKAILRSHFPLTMAILCGLLLGSLRKLWPFQTDTTPDVHELKHKIFVPRGLSQLSWTSDILPALGIAVVAALIAFAIDYITGTTQHEKAN